MFKFRKNFGASPNAPDNLHDIAGSGFPNTLKQPGRRCFQDGGKRHQSLGRDAAPVMVFNSALQIANRIWTLGGERSGVRGKAHGLEAAFDPEENVFKFHSGRVTEHGQPCTR